MKVVALSRSSNLILRACPLRRFWNVGFDTNNCLAHLTNGPVDFASLFSTPAATPSPYGTLLTSSHRGSDSLISFNVSYVNPWDLVKDPARPIWPPSSRGSPQNDGHHASSESIGLVSPAEIHVPGVEGVDLEVEVEPPFLLEAPSRSFKYVFMHHSPLQGIYT